MDSKTAFAFCATPPCSASTAGAVVVRRARRDGERLRRSGRTAIRQASGGAPPRPVRRAWATAPFAFASSRVARTQPSRL